MKTKEEIFDSLMPVSLTKEGFIKIFEDTQKEAWNEAIEAAAENAEATFERLDETHSVPFVKMESILKLKK